MTSRGRSGKVEPTGAFGWRLKLMVFGAFVLGALLGTWIASVIAVQLGGFYSGEVLREGTADVGDCRTSIFLDTSCEARVTWEDGTTEDRRILSPSRPGESSVAIAEHERTLYGRGSIGTSSPLILTSDVETTQRGGLSGFAITAAGLIAMLLVGLGVALRVGRHLRVTD